MEILDIFSNKKINKIKEKIPKIIVDIREKQSLLASELVRTGCEIEFKVIEIGDYLIKNYTIERKTVSDFLSSMINGRLKKQLINLQKAKNPLLMIEGIDERELYHSESKVNENAVRGFLLSIILNYKIPIIMTKDYEDSAKFLKILAKKPSKEKEDNLNIKRKSLDINEQLQYLIEGFPGIGPKNAKKLLRHFKTFKEIINSPIEEIEKIIGKKASVFKIIDAKYTQEE